MKKTLCVLFAAFFVVIAGTAMAGVIDKTKSETGEAVPQKGQAVANPDTTAAASKAPCAMSAEEFKTLSDQIRKEMETKANQKDLVALRSELLSKDKKKPGAVTKLQSEMAEAKTRETAMNTRISSLEEAVKAHTKNISDAKWEAAVAKTTAKEALTKAKEAKDEIRTVAEFNLYGLVVWAVLFIALAILTVWGVFFRKPWAKGIEEMKICLEEKFPSTENPPHC